MAPRLVFVHGVGKQRRAEDERRCWIAALAEGARKAGHSAAAKELTDGDLADVEFPYYGDLFFAPQAQGLDDTDLDDNETEMLIEFLAEIIGRLRDDPEPGQCPDVDQRDLTDALAKLRSQGQPQGSGELLRLAIDAATTLLDAGPWRNAGQWATGNLLIGDLKQVPRYLGRSEADHGRTLDERIRARVAAALGPGPAVVVAHSLGTVVSYETLHHYSGDVPLWVTLGSPLGMRAVVWPKLRPAPATPPTVRRWLNFWDRDDIIVARPDLEADIIPNVAGVRPESGRVDSDGAWVHDAVKYLSKSDVAGPVIEAIQAAR